MKGKAMLDRFRFRGWYYNPKDKSDIYNNTMCYDAEDTYDCLGGNPPIMENNFWCILNSDCWTVEQCTGLKDKNGKLIYEGDIVSYKVPSGKYNGVVRWDKNTGGWLKSTGGDALHTYIKTVEVIGNIHENRE